MEEHGDLTKPISNPKGRIVTIQHWEELTSLLNSDGSGDTKTTEKWKKVFRVYLELSVHYARTCFSTLGTEHIRYLLLIKDIYVTIVMSMQKTYKISAICEQDVENVMKLLKRTFYIDEPLNRTVGLCTSETDPCPELDDYCTSSLLEGMSFKATDDAGNVVGAIINGVCPLKEDENGNDLLSQAQQCLNPKFQRILYLMARTESGARLWEKFPNDKLVVEVKVVATDPDWRRKGIMNALLLESEKAIKEKGVRLIRLDTSSAYAAMSAERLGYTCFYKALHKDIKMDGQPLIVPDPPHVEDRKYIKELYPL